ncbi:jacalin-like lectin domain-containing protein [Artemisia annua]|uniref:Jacalin-like lectin domain-containing protein n=1 Tax=Artemisia annua TaxID=35608 RepID=A0A2U1LBR7_ARTAN|nr:jacalin-like lectin domain-containing protein [Artemisia annua]
MSHIPELNNLQLQLPLNDIMSATNNFSEQNYVGQGGFGRVYKGQLQPCGTIVAVKRLDTRLGQGRNEFLKEILMLASYKHDNLVSLIGFCDQGQEKILVYKHEDMGSLDKHLASTNLTWEQRLRICLSAARGLDYLHRGVGTGHKVIHCDIKSSNILLDANWEAKISDFGLSKVALKNQQFTFLVTTACGTLGYLDPLYMKMGVLTKESDVYSFGVVLFEVLCGRLAMVCEYEDERRFLSSWVKLNNKNKKFQQIIIPFLREQMKPDSVSIFFKIALQCLNDDRQQRPTMGSIVKELETALEAQLDTRTTESEPQIGTRTELFGSTSPGGDPFLFQLESNQKLKKITISHNDQWIYSLTFTAEDSNGLLHSSEKYGGIYDHNDRCKFEQINFDDDEEMIGISGTHGKYYDLDLISSLCFVTTKKKYGTFGKEADTSFSGSWDVGRFDGFYGLYGWYIDAIGCCLKAKI